MRINRYATHAVVLLVAAVLSAYSYSSYLEPARGSIDARAASVGGAVGDVSVGRDTTIIKPLSIPTSTIPSRAPIFYKVKDGDTLPGIATTLGVPLRQITWSNPGLRNPLKVGEVLRYAPVPGFVVAVKSGDSLESVAATYGIDPTTIVDFNRVRDPLTAGSVLVIPVDPEVGPNLSSGVPADPIKPGQLVCPIPGASIIQKFGPTSFALEPAYDGYPHFHTGVDILAGYGVPIAAAAGGRVTAVGPEGAFGIRVEVTDSYGLVEIYAHMEQVSVALGQLVQQGDNVGLVGSTGLSIGSHLHLQLEVGGVPTDPMPLIGCAA
ncbi:MAG: peptidoglycan DD-metalloendopeptidase family protein [Candidatus Dormiibacterota bacterium]